MSDDGVQGPFPGLTVSQERLQLEGISLDDVRRALAEVFELRAGASALTAERDLYVRKYDEARAEVERLRAERDEARAGDLRSFRAAAAQAAALDTCIAERDRLLAALAETEENWQEISTCCTFRGWNFSVAEIRSILAVLRARAGMEPTPAGPGVMRDMVHASEENADGVFFVDLECGHRKATRAREVSYLCLDCKEPTP